jgi:intracellular multiplication protein IcmJ
MQLRPLRFVPATEPYPGDGGEEAQRGVAQLPCAFCGVRSGPWQEAVGIGAERGSAAAPDPLHYVAACPLCALPLHLLRPHIDEEAALIWLPEMSQAALNALMRGVHKQLRTFGETLHDVGHLRRNRPELRAAYYTRRVLSERSPAAQSRLGTTLPSELGSVLLYLSQNARANQVALLGGLRLLPLGGFYIAGENVYRGIVDTWLGLTGPSSSFSAEPDAAGAQ